VCVGIYLSGSERISVDLVYVGVDLVLETLMSTEGIRERGGAALCTL
jgi:hypothetical protein